MPQLTPLQFLRHAGKPWGNRPSINYGISTYRTNCGRFMIARDRVNEQSHQNGWYVRMNETACSLDERVLWYQYGFRHEHFTTRRETVASLVQWCHTHGI